MPHKYAEIAFTSSVQAVQQEMGSRRNYAAMEQGEDSNQRLGSIEAAFVASRDSFYMASVSQTGWPYVQHRGGPPGFVRVLDEQTLGFADFRGNRQYVSVGNLRHDSRVALFFMDYPNRTRLKIFGRVRFIKASDTAALARLESPDYRATVERGLLIDVEGFDWNCPQHITPRFTEGELAGRIEPLQDRIAELEAGQRPTLPPVVGEGPLELVITAVRQLTPRVRGYELRDADGRELPPVTAGSHLEIPSPTKVETNVFRNYSLCSNPARRDAWEIAVLRDNAGQGGSVAIHEWFQVGQRLRCQLPRNHFALHKGNRPAILIAGGIGITPIKAMAQALQAGNTDFHLHYAGRSRREMAFAERLQRVLGEKLHLYPADEGQRMNLDSVMSTAPAGAVIYICGPERLIKAAQQAANAHGIPRQRVRHERFSAAALADDQALRVRLKNSAVTVDVAADQSVLDAVLDAGIDTSFSCRVGTCRTCAVKVLQGEPEHRDNALSDAERERGMFCPCVSRGEGLVLEL